jgi:hypothetical protein
MAVTSSYVQISDYAVVEYFYQSEIISTSKAKALRLSNGYSKQYQFLNSASAKTLTGNVLDTSVVQLGSASSRWGYLDIDTVAPIIQIDPNISVEDVTNLLLPNIKYDKVRLHLLSGFDLPGLDGLVMQVLWNQWDISGTSGTPFAAASQAYIKGDENLEFNTKPLFMGDRLFDRYLEFKFPSLAEVNFDYWNSPTSPNTIGYQYTFGNVGFQKEGQIVFKLLEIDQTQIERGNKYFVTGEEYVTSFNQSDLYSYISAVVEENAEYDYIDYYPTWNGQFLEDYIGLLNAGGGDWVVINQIDVYEQLGTNFDKTFSMTSLQDTGFNAPSSFRPIIRNSALAISYSVEYTMRLLNKANNQEIIRKATYTSMNPKKYGVQLEKINIVEGFRPIKVYNKVVQVTEGDGISTSVQYLGSPTIMTQNVYVNSYYDVNYISVDSSTEMDAQIGQKVWPQGTNYIFLTPFDNYVKFKVFTKSADKKQDVTLDLSSTGMNIKLAFITSDNTRNYIDPTIDLTAADPGVGEVLFRVDDSIAIKLLNDTTRSYYLVNKNTNGDDVLIYTGNFAKLSERKEILARIELEAAASLATAALNATTTATAGVTGTTAATVTTPAATGATATATTENVATPTAEDSTANGPLAASQSEQISTSQQAVSTVQSSSSTIESSIQQAVATNTLQDLVVPDIPGVTPTLGANISAAITPNVIKPSSPGTFINPQEVTSSALDKTKGLKTKKKPKK